MMVNLNEAKAQLSKYVEVAANGETVVICKRNVPVAEIRAISKSDRGKPVFGSAAGAFTIPANFFEPLPEYLLAAFDHGQDSGTRRRRKG